MHKQLTLYGLWVCGNFELGELLEHLVRKRLHPGATLTHSFPLSETKQAYGTFDAQKGGQSIDFLGGWVSSVTVKSGASVTMRSTQEVVKT